MTWPCTAAFWAESSRVEISLSCSTACAKLSSYAISVCNRLTLLAASWTRAVFSLPASACFTISLAVSCERLMSSCSLRACAIQPSTSGAASVESLRTSFWQHSQRRQSYMVASRTFVSSRALATTSSSLGSALEGTVADATCSSWGNAPCAADWSSASPS